MSISERGMKLVFRRTYNSQSRYDYSISDGTTRALFGNGWTNTFDAHISYSGGTTPSISVWDVDGARYKYVSNGTGGWTPPAGMQGTTLAPNASNSCYYDWTKKDGTVFEFYIWNFGSSGCPGAAIGQNSRIAKIYGRNSNNWIQFGYNYQPGQSTAPYLTSIVATHSDGDTITLNLMLNSNGHNLASSIQTSTASGSKTVSYRYDANDNLTDVCGLNNGSSYPVSSPCPTGSIHQQYGYNANHQLSLVNSPNWVMTDYGCGSYHTFQYDGLDRITAFQDAGSINPYLPDGTSNGGSPTTGCVNVGSVLQPSYAANYANQETQYWVGSYAYGSGTTNFTDTDGHSSEWTYDSSLRVTHTAQGNVATGTQGLLNGSASWDSQNNKIETIDARGRVTDFAYDANGNVIAIAGPAATPGGTRPTALYSYEIYNGFNYNNLSAYCDPKLNGTSGYDWVNRPQNDSLCTASTAEKYTYTHPSGGYEPYGETSNSYQKSGYGTSVSYSPSNQGGLDYGLASDTNGTCINSQNDGTSRCAHEQFFYDTRGNVTSASAADGQGTYTFTYDTLNRQITSTDPMGVTSYTYYYDNGNISKAETAYQHSTGLGQAKTYDADGNVITESASHGGTYSSTSSSPTLAGTATTYKYYDAEDRLVEVALPHDSTDAYTQGWITRYIYDISGQGAAAALSFRGQTLPNPAYGNLWKTQEWLPANTNVVIGTTANPSTPQPIAQVAFADQKGQSYDVLDRLITSTVMVHNASTDVQNTTTSTYDTGINSDGVPNASLLVSTCNNLNVCTNHAYDDAGREIGTSFSDATPSRSATYDLNNRLLTVSNVYGKKTYTYGVYGRLMSTAEALTSANGVSLTSSTTITYNYYPDGLRSSLDVATSGTGAFSQTAMLSYAYRADGKLTWEQVDDTNVPGYGTNAGATQYHLAYNNSGQLTQRTESGLGANATAMTATYDSNGLASSKTFAGGSTTQIEYDAMAAPLGYKVNGGSAVQYTYTDRGELEQNGTGLNYADGVTLGGTASLAIGSGSVATVDTAMGVVLSGDVPQPSGCMGGHAANSFDNAGRLTGESGQIAVLDAYQTCHTGSASSFSRTFDAENHVISQTSQSQSIFNPTNDSWMTGAIGSSSYAWGADGHPIAIGSGYSGPNTTGTPAITGYDTLHWDGDTLLFTTNSSGAIDDIKLGAFADFTPAMGPIVYDRAFGTSIVFCHNGANVGGSGGAYGTSQAEAYPCGTTLFGNNAAPSFRSTDSAIVQGVGNGGILGMPHGDGISDGYIAIQGVRTKDDSSGLWASPDTYAGSLDNPVTQKPYVWNSNNPITLMDPSGFDPIPTPPPYKPTPPGGGPTPGPQPNAGPGASWCQLHMDPNPVEQFFIGVASGIALGIATDGLGLLGIAASSVLGTAIGTGPDLSQPAYCGMGDFNQTTTYIPLNGSGTVYSGQPGADPDGYYISVSTTTPQTTYSNNGSGSATSTTTYPTVDDVNQVGGDPSNASALITVIPQ